MTTKKTERILFYDEKEHRWIVETMELEEEVAEATQASDENNNQSERRVVY